MDYLRDGIHLRAMAQKDPLVEYRAEGHAMFEELGGAIREEVVLTLFHAQVEVEPSRQLEPEQGERQPPVRARDRRRRGRDRRRGAGSGGGSSATAFALAGRRHATATAAVNEHKDVGRNDPCWCGSGKKFKKCHGA